VRTVGPVPFHESAWYLAACDVFVVPQVRTPFAEHQLPAKLVQAMALGCPVVATDVGDARELLGGVPPAGIVVPPDDPGALAEAVRGLLSSPTHAARLGAEARRRAEAELGWAAMCRAVEGVFREVGVRV
jgi:glycosyltransferase involved in cell wall biosynthesis